MSRVRKDQLREKLETLDTNEHAQIFLIVQKYTDKYTKTQTGVLVSSEVIPEECLVEMERMITFFIDQHKVMDADDKERKGYDRR